MNYRVIVSWIIGVLWVADTILISAYFYSLSSLSEEELRKSPNIDFSFWVDYFGWISFVFICIYLHSHRDDFTSEAKIRLPQISRYEAKILTIIICDVIPLIFVIVMFIRSLKWILFSSGPGFE